MNRRPLISPSASADTSLVVLAGGKAERLAGRNKASLELRGETLLGRRIRLLAPFFRQIIVVWASPHQAEAEYPHLLHPVRHVIDPVQGVGPLMGLFSGLSACPTEWAFVTACDMPFYSPPLLEHMRGCRNGWDAVVPRIGDWLEPLFSFYHRRCLPAIRQTLQEKRRRIIAFYSSIKPFYVAEEDVLRLDPGKISFFNINTQEDLQAAVSLAAGGL
jgi:molybdopterin-guanine dinucleotide biosynthesis protein A